LPSQAKLRSATQRLCAASHPGQRPPDGWPEIGQDDALHGDIERLHFNQPIKNWGVMAIVESKALRRLHSAFQHKYDVVFAIPSNGLSFRMITLSLYFLLVAVKPKGNYNIIAFHTTL
jgi:hypothetical protein